MSMYNNTLDYVMDTIENEGFEYALVYYSSFKEVDDPVFHNLRETYINSRQELITYLQDLTEREVD